MAHNSKKTRRLIGKAALGSYKFLIRLLSPISPDRAAALTENVAMRPRRYKRPAWEAENLKTATRHEFWHLGKRIAFWHWGADDMEQDDKPVILLLHGWAGRGSQISDFAAPLLKAGFQVLAMDAPAHGESDWGHITMGDYGKAVLALSDFVEKPVYGLIGHSMGGAVAVLACHMGLDCRNVAIIGAPATAHGFLRIAKRELGLTDRVAERLKQRALERSGIDWDNIDIRIQGRDIEGLRLLVLHDEDDKPVSVETGKSIAEAIPGAESMITKGLGHRRILRDAGVHARATAFMLHGLRDKFPQ